MKKIISMLLVVVLATASLFCITTNAKADTVSEYSADWYAYAGSVLWKQGNADNVVKENPQTYEKHAGNPGADIVGFYGWAALKEGKIKSYGIKLDGGAMINSPLSREQDAALDRTAELEKANKVNAEGFWMVFYYTDLGPGKHNAAFFAIGEDGKEHALFDYDFTVVAREPDQWLCDASAAAYMGGMWLWGLDRNISLTFTAPNAFSGVCTLFFTSGSDLMFTLLDKDGKELEKVECKGVVEGVAVTAQFSKAYKAGTYTLDISPTSLTEVGGNAYAVLATYSPRADLPVEVAGVFDYCSAADWNNMAGTSYPDNANQAPFMFLVGAAKEASSETPVNPGTADAAVIAIAAVACVALAGIVVAKKIK